MSNEKVDDDTIYRTTAGELSKDELQQIQKLLNAWADAQEKLTPSPNVKIVFAACVHVIGTMGPAWCKMAILTLGKRASDMEGENADPTRRTH